METALPIRTECQFYVDNYNTSDGTLTLTTGDGVNQIKLQSAAGAVSFGRSGIW